MVIATHVLPFHAPHINHRGVSYHNDTVQSLPCFFISFAFTTPTYIFDLPMKSFYFVFLFTGNVLQMIPH